MKYLNYPGIPLNATTSDSNGIRTFNVVLN